MISYHSNLWHYTQWPTGYSLCIMITSGSYLWTSGGVVRRGVTSPSMGWRSFWWCFHSAVAHRCRHVMSMVGVGQPNGRGLPCRFVHRRCRVVSIIGVGLPTSAWVSSFGAGPRCCRGIGEDRGSKVSGRVTKKREGRKWSTTFVVAHFRDLPPISHFPPPAPPSAIFSIKRDHNGPTSLGRGEGCL